MTEQEQREFEKRKKEAENQLNRMYYGSSAGATNKGLKMPPFLNNPQPKNQKNHTDENKNNAPKEPHQSNVVQKQTIQNKKSGIDLLNLLNFKGIKMDNDRLVVLALCLLLSSEDVDELLLLALMYIMF